MNSKINSIELYVCLAFWIFSNGYALHELYDSQTAIFDFYPEETSNLSDLQPGWYFLSRFKDISDVEWSSWKYFIQISWSYLIVQFMISEFIYKTKVCHLKHWYIMSSLIFVTLLMGYKQLLLISLQPLLYAGIILAGGKTLSVWATSILLLISYNSLKYKTFFWYFLDHENLYDEEVYLILFCMPWIELRCISFCLDYIETLESKKSPPVTETLINMLSYVLYVPVMYTGPVILYEDFKKSFERPRDFLSVRLKRFTCDMCIFLFYTFILDLAQHYIYFYAMQDEIELIRMLPTIALCGGGLWMGIQFHMKYVIGYGTGTAFAKLDNIETPPTPRCIVRIHVYSQMWRHFDVGLYRFLVKYIYKPSYSVIESNFQLPKTVNKILASFGAFFFIFLWHGTIKRILIWTLLNYLGITLEYTSQAIAKTNRYQWFKQKVLRSEAMETRFIALLCVPLLLLSAISNFYLFAGTRVGNLYFEYFLQPPYFNLNALQVGLALYCCCIVSMALQDVPSRTDVKKIIKVE